MKLSGKQLVLCGLLGITLLQIDAQALKIEDVTAVLGKFPAFVSSTKNGIQNLPLPAKLVVYPTIAVPVAIIAWSALQGFLGNTYELWLGDENTPSKDETFTSSIRFLKFVTPGFPDCVRGWIGIPVLPVTGAAVKTYDNFKSCAARLNRAFVSINKKIVNNINKNIENNTNSSK